MGRTVTIQRSMHPDQFESLVGLDRFFGSALLITGAILVVAGLAIRCVRRRRCALNVELRGYVRERTLDLGGRVEDNMKFNGDSVSQGDFSSASNIYMTEPSGLRDNYHVVQAKSRGKDFFFTCLWLSAFLAVLTGYWGFQGDALMLQFSVWLASLSLCLFLLFIGICVVRGRHPITVLRQSTSFRSLMRFAVSLLFFVLLVAVATVLSLKR